MVLRCERFAHARAPLSFKVSLNTIKVILVDFVNLRKVPKLKKKKLSLENIVNVFFFLVVQTAA